MNNSNFMSKLIDNKTAKELSDNFLTNKAEIIERRYGKEDTNAIWFSLEDIEAYIAFVKRSGEDLGIKVNGLRIFFGSYHDNVSVKHAGLNTVFFTPTKEVVARNTADNTANETKDAIEIQSFNYGGVGQPPKIIFGPLE